jgi:hypothetical protein
MQFTREVQAVTLNRSQACVAVVLLSVAWRAPKFRGVQHRLTRPGGIAPP